MKQLSLTLAFILTASAAFAYQCPADIGKIDAAIEAGTSLSDADLAQVKAWRDEGEALHTSGDHQAAVDTLAKAKDKLGLE